MYKKQLFSLSLTLILVLLFSALGPTTVYADDGAPPDDQTAEGSDSGGETTDEVAVGEQAGDTGEGETVDATTDEASDGEAVEAATNEVSDGETVDAVTDEAVSDGETLEATTDETVTDQASDGEAEQIATDEEVTAEEPSLMEQVPDNTEIVVVNAEGEAEPLATQDAAEAVAISDPIWCPAGQGPDGADCTDSYSNFDDLLSFLKTNESDPTYQQAGTIYVEMGNYGGGEGSIDFNSYGFTTFENNDLTIQGGWNTSDNTTTATTTFDVPIVIGSDVNPWGGSLTLRNIIVTGVVNDTGLTVYSDGDVTIEDSEFTNNDVAGAVIDAGGDVTVRRSKVNDNGSNNWRVVDGKGLEIISGGFVTLSDVEANDNQIFGADITAANAVTIGNSFFNGNLMYTPDMEFYGYGLTVVSDGDISLEGVEANDNYLWGADLDGPNVFIRDSFFNHNVSDTAVYIDDTGLLVASPGDVFLLNVEANDNRMIGADINADGDVTITDSSFSRNFGTTVDANGVETYWGYGLQVNSGGEVTLGVGDALLGVAADDNYLFGANLVALNDDVNIEGSSFSRNGTPADQANAQGGLMIQSGGFVTLDTVTVNDNNLFGADIVADGFISIDNSAFSNNLNGFGLSAVSTTAGIVTLTNVTATGNGGDGAYLETACGEVDVNGGVFGGNTQNGLTIINSLYTQTATFDPPNGGDPISFSPGNCVFASPLAPSAPQYVVAALAEGGLPGILGAGNTFVSALEVTSTGGANGDITLYFPIPAGMEDSNLAVMFWDGTEWVDVPGGTVVGNQFVITVSQSGVYVLVSR